MTAKEQTPKLPITLTPSWELAGRSIELVRYNLEQIVILQLLPAFMIILGRILMKTYDLHSLTSRQDTGLALVVAGVLWTIVNYPAMFYLQLQAAKGDRPSVGECYRKSWRFFWRILGVAIVYGVAVTIGLVVFIVPGLIFLRRYFLSFYYVIDQDLGVLEAMKKSADESKPVHGYVWGVIGVEVAFGFAGSALGLIPVVGIILSPLVDVLYIFGPALRYREVAALPRP